MITENYLQIMIDSLLKKIEILKKVSELNEEQSALLDDKEFDGDKLQSNMESITSISAQAAHSIRASASRPSADRGFTRLD